ncbi:MarR family transcriptional regulator [Variovorax sp. WS11]|uniref:MarR family winged helix-turn-helix transcriptional regulator n=1 Tax=Variovorax sp. WS11 TaxID=1105204 RepID=UPI000D0DF071|nr:MarR family winged helix-turn-helix transcriptional regulator [Variovorax sp. WS11]NDZ13650.1 winged helix-turn-helix transcriptional regulator [Variovorax sp. WS11]PSL79216.1 MarR family transcriptional regulator [Variovorax sp. WS11]
MSKNDQSASKLRLEALSEFRFRLRSFLRFSEDAARDAGITVLQYQVLLHTQGFPGREWASVGEIAERLQAQPHGVVALVSRCEEAGLVKRKPSTVDRRLVEVHLLPKGRKVLAMLAQQHALELSHLAEAVRLANEIQGEIEDGEA